MEKVILAYSGGLDTSVILKWLINKGFEVVCMIANVGQDEDFECARKKALEIGASKVYIEDLQEEFITGYIYKAIKANAVYEGKYLLGTAIARPLIAKRQVEIAKEENTKYVSHGATGKGNDQVRFELAYYKLMPDVTIISPWKDEEFLAHFKGRQELLEYASQHDIPVESTQGKPYSIDENLMHSSYEGGILEDPSQHPPKDLCKKTCPETDAPENPASIKITFKAGIPVSVENLDTGEYKTKPLDMFAHLNMIGGDHAIGRIDIVENRFVGIKSRGLYETPGATILLEAHKELERLVLDKEVFHLKEKMSLDIAEIIYNGFWFSPEMDFLMAAIEKSQESLDGEVTLKLYKGNILVQSRTSPRQAYDSDLASMDKEGDYDPKDAKGFIRIQALRL